MVWYQKTRWSNSKKQVIYGKHYDSGFEGEMAIELTAKLKNKEIQMWDSHVKIPLICNGYEIGSYKIDFLVAHNDKSLELIEMKGVKYPDWAWRWKVLETMVQTNPQKYFNNPSVRMTLIKQANNFTLRKPKKI